MAQVKLGVALADVRGGVGGSVFQKNATGLTLRNNTTPVNPQSNGQSANRSKSFRLQSLWQNLTDDQRTAWQTWAEFQNLETGFFSTSLMTGQQAFYQLNWYRLTSGQSVLSAPSFTGYDIEASVVALYADGVGSFTIEITSSALPAEIRPIFRISSLMRASQNKAPGGLRNITPTLYTSLTYNVAASYVATYGNAPAPASKVEMEYGFQQVSNGTLSVFSREIFIVQDVP